MRIAQSVHAGHGVAKERRTVAVIIEAAIVVLCNAPLAAGHRRAHHPFPVDQPHALGGLGIVQPVIQPEHQAVFGVFNGPLSGVVVDDRSFLVGFQVAIGVFTEPNRGWLGHQHAAFHQRHGTRHLQAGEKLRAPVHAAVVICILQHGNGAHFGILTGAVDVGHVRTHFHNPHAPIGIKLHGHRIPHQRIGCHQLNAEARRKLKGLERLRRGQSRRRWHVKILPNLGLLLAAAIAPLGLRHQGQGQYHHQHVAETGKTPHGLEGSGPFSY